MSKEQVARKMADNLRNTEAYQKLEAARKEIEEDEEAGQLLEEFENLRDELQQKQTSDSLEKKDMEKFKAARDKLLSHPAFQKQQQAARELQDTVQNLVEELSSLIDLPVDDYLAGGTA